MLGALSGEAALLTSVGATFLVSVQPDALGLCLAAASLVAFVAWTEGGAGRLLLASTVLLALSAGVKPTNLALGLSQFILAYVSGRLRDGRLWLAWASVLGFVGVVLAWGAHVHDATGNTFGVISGGDSKFPTLARLTSPGQYLGLLRTGLVFGPGWLGAAALAWTLIRGPRSPVLLALLAGYVLTGLVAMRYASEAWLGSHYHALGMLVGAVSVGFTVSARPPRTVAAVVTLVALACLAQLAYGLHERPRRAAGWSDRELSLASALAPHLVQGDRLVFRAAVESQVPIWGGPNNFEDPRLFYLTRTTGWVLPSDRWSIPEVEAAWRLGARLYVDATGALGEHPEFLEWLLAHGERLATVDQGVIVRLRPPH